MIDMIEWKKGLALAGLVSLALSAPALASPYVQDNAKMFSAETISKIEAQSQKLDADLGKTVTVVTVDSINGAPIDQAAAAEAKAQALNGAIIYIAKDDRRLSIAYGPNTIRIFPPSVQQSIKQDLRSAFRRGDFDGGIVQAVNRIAGVMESGGRAAAARAPAEQPAPAANLPAQDRQGNSGGGVSWMWWVVGIIVLILILRAVGRRQQAQAPPGQQYPPGAYPPGSYPPGGYPPGAGGGGSGFLPGLLGGAAGAFVGSELAQGFNRGNQGQSGVGADPAAAAPDPGAGWQADDAGGGFTDSGGGGDFGGGDAGGGGDGGGW